jgi:hypothetical protein
MPSSTFDVEELRQILSYDPKTGVFTWRVGSPRGGRQIAGNVAGNLGVEGYRHIRIKKRLYLAHRLAWLYVTGDWPGGDIDHKNGVPGDNRFANLREVTHAANMQNSKRRKHNTSGFKGVRLSAAKKNKRWFATIQKDGRMVYLGTFPTPEEAHAAYRKAAEVHHGEFARFA